MFLKLRFTQVVAQKLMEGHWIDFPWMLASLFNEDITAIYVIRRPCGLVGGRMPNRGNQISVQMAKKLKLTALMFKLVRHCFKPYDIKHINSRAELEYQHQWDLEQKKLDNLKVSKKMTRTTGQRLLRTQSYTPSS